MVRTASPMNGKTTSAITARRQSRTTMTPVSTTTITTFRIVITMTVDDRRASRFTSDTMRDARLRRVAAREERQWHVLDVDVEVVPELRDHALADRRHQVGVAVAGGALEHERPEEQERDDPQHRHVAPDEDVVHGGLHEPRDRAFHRRDHDGQRVPSTILGTWGLR